MDHQTPQAKKDALLDELVAVRQRILERCRQFNHTMVGRPFVGEWSVLELLAHFVGWDFANREAAEAILAGRLPGFYDHPGKDWSEFNQILVQRHLSSDLDRMLAAVAESHQSLVGYLESIPPTEFFKDRGLRFRGYKVILGRLLKSEAEDEAAHLDQIEAFLSQEFAE